MTSSDDSFHSDTTDADGGSDWDLSATSTPLDEIGQPDAEAIPSQDSGEKPNAGDVASLTVEAEVAPSPDDAVETSDEEDDEVPLVADESVECYQTHFLEDDEPETDYVAHVEVSPELPVAAVPAEAVAKTPQVEPETVQPRYIDDEAAVASLSQPLVKLAGNDALTAALVGSACTASPAELRPVAIQAPRAPMPVATEPTPSSCIEHPVEPDVIEDQRESQDEVAIPEPPRPEQTAVHPTSRSERFESASGTKPAEIPYAEVAGEDYAYNEHDAAAEDEAAVDDAEFDGVPYESWAETPAPSDDELEEALPAATGGGWTIPLLCLGIAIIAFCLVIPQADANRRLAYERSSLRADLESIQTQVATNDEFLRKLASDPTLAERLAQRQLNLQRAGTKALAVGLRDGGTSPFDLVKVPPPPAVEPYEPVGGKLAAVCREGHSRLYLMGVGLFVLAAGLVLGVSPAGRL